MSCWTTLQGIEIRKDGKWVEVNDPSFEVDVGGGRKILDQWGTGNSFGEYCIDDYNFTSWYTLQEIIDEMNDYVSGANRDDATKSFLQERLEEKQKELGVEPSDLRIIITFDP